MQPGIYIHLPFCSVHCSYCDFPLTTRRSLAPAYYDALFWEIEERPADKADTLYFGGGTPSLTEPGILMTLIHKFSLSAGSEITLEANPDDLSDEKLDSWRAAGISRLSIGIQSLEDNVLRSMLRQHTASEALAALKKAKSHAFESVNVDLILGMPGQNPDRFVEGLQQLIDFGPHHFSLYFLEMHENTALDLQLKKGKVRLMDEDEQLSCHTAAIGLLEKAGYAQYEISNFALRGHESLHNLKYWQNAPYYGYGAGAASYVPPKRSVNRRSIPEYIRDCAQKQLPVAERQVEDLQTEMRNSLIFGLRRKSGIDLDEFETQYGVSPLSLFRRGAALFLENGLLEQDAGRLRLTARGMLLSNEVLSEVI